MDVSKRGEEEEEERARGQLGAWIKAWHVDGTLSPGLDELDSGGS